MPEKFTKTVTAHIRMSEEEMAGLDQAALAAGRNRSDWMREALISAAQETPVERRLRHLGNVWGERILLTLEEWQHGKDLSSYEVRERTLRLAEEAAGPV